MNLKQYVPFGLFGILVVAFFYQVVLFGRIPIAADTIVGLYHPYRDLHAIEYPNGIPFKNFLITDPVRQQYPWRLLSIESFRSGELPFWNPYSGVGSPLLANIQSAALYPFNILFFVLPFVTAWSILVMLQCFLAGFFLYLYLRFFRINKLASTLGGIAFAFCGFNVAWMTWNTLAHVGLWLPLILLAKEKIILKPTVRWMAVLLFAESAAFFAGHLQTFFYVVLLSTIYLFARILQKSWHKTFRDTAFSVIRLSKPFVITGTLMLILTSVVWIPFLQFASVSERAGDVANWRGNEGWFLPWQHLVQLVAPDFFGNPTTLNYWGTWNYGELVGYVGIAPLLFALYALFFRHDKKTAFFGTALFISLFFALPNFIAKLPFLLEIPFLSTAQPTRLLFLVDLCLAVLAALGFDFYIRQKYKRNIFYPAGFLFLVFVGLWIVASVGNLSHMLLSMNAENLIVAKRNLLFPTAIFGSISFLIFISAQLKTERYITTMIRIIVVAVTIIELFRFGWKFTPFTDTSYLYPQTEVLSFLQQQDGQFRVMTTDERILPPNFSNVYHIRSVDLYDPLYDLRYAEFIAAMERGEPNISPPFGFNRIITPENVNSSLINLLNVKYVMSFDQLDEERFKHVFQEGQTTVFENTEVLPRVFFVENVMHVSSRQHAIEALFDEAFDAQRSAIVEEFEKGSQDFAIGNASIIKYTNNSVVIRTENEQEGFLVLLDAYYPSWSAQLKNGEELSIFRTNYLFRGVIVPAGDQEVTFKANLL